MFINPDSSNLQRENVLLSSEKEEIYTGSTVIVSESIANPSLDEESSWLRQWIVSEGVERFIGNVVGSPKLVLDHVAGRVYKIRTKKKKEYFVVIGYGRPIFYPLKKRLTEPKEILSYHRGSGIITKMKVEYIRAKKSESNNPK